MEGGARGWRSLKTQRVNLRLIALIPLIHYPWPQFFLASSFFAPSGEEALVFGQAVLRGRRGRNRAASYLDFRLDPCAQPQLRLRSPRCWELGQGLSPIGLLTQSPLTHLLSSPTIALSSVSCSLWSQVWPSHKTLSHFSGGLFLREQRLTIVFSLPSFTPSPKTSGNKESIFIGKSWGRLLQLS